MKNSSDQVGAQMLEKKRGEKIFNTTKKLNPKVEKQIGNSSRSKISSGILYLFIYL